MCKVKVRQDRHSLPITGDFDGTAVTVEEAEKECAARSMRLCAPDELTWCCNSGCYHDRRHVWTSEECTVPQLSAAAVAAPGSRWPLD